MAEEKTKEPRQWFGAEIPQDRYERYKGYVQKHREEGMTFGSLIVTAIDQHLASEPEEAEPESK